MRYLQDVTVQNLLECLQCPYQPGFQLCKKQSKGVKTREFHSASLCYSSQQLAASSLTSSSTLVEILEAMKHPS